VRLGGLHHRYDRAAHSEPASRRENVRVPPS
jgi:hypothetical protein